MRDGRHFISSAVVSALPDHAGEVAARIADLPDTEVPFREGGKIVVVMEGPSTGAIGSRLTEIALMQGVLSANMVFEQAVTLDGEANDAQPA